MHTSGMAEAERQEEPREESQALRRTSNTSIGTVNGSADPLQPSHRATLLRHWLLLLAFIVGGGLFGRAISLIPSPSEVTMFWVSNLASPWLALAFLAGWSQRSRLWAAGTGALADVASIVGFYGQFLFIDNYYMLTGPSRRFRSTPLLILLVEYNLNHWLHFVAPWVLAAIVTGAAYGLLGYWWGRHRSIVAGALVALPFIAEPWLWRIYLGFYKDPLILWVAEVAVGVALLVWVIRAWTTQHHQLTTRQSL